MPGDTPLSKLQAIMRLAYAMRSDEEAVLARDIERQRVQAWTQAIREEAQKLGIRQAVPFPRGEALDLIRRQSIEDAHSIRNTYNADLEREIQRLYSANARGNRQYYISNIERWHRDRAVWKNRQIALMNNKTARYWAQQAFTEANKLRTDYRFVGPAPVCDDCAAMFAAGVVVQDFVDQNPTPLHPNCPHEWATVGARLGVPVSQVWLG